MAQLRGGARFEVGESAYMTCLKDETLAALARGVIPQGELGRIREHLPACPRCLEAVARSAWSRPREPRATVKRSSAAPLSSAPLPSEPGPSRGLRWGAVWVAALTVALSALWVSTDGQVMSRAGDTVSRVADAAHGAAIGAEVRRVWRSLRDGVEARLHPAEPVAATVATPAPDPEPTVAPPAPGSLPRQDDAAASARIAEASRLVERSNAIAASSSRAAGDP